MKVNESYFFQVLLVTGIFILPVLGFGRVTFEDHVSKQHCFNSSDGIMQYRDEGSGVPILLLHGVPTSGWMWREMIVPLSEQGFRVIVPDMLGFGMSDTPSGEGVYHAEEHAKRLIELQDHLDIESWNMVVHDNAFFWMKAYHEKSPGTIQSVIYVNAAISPEMIDLPGVGLDEKLGLLLSRIGLTEVNYVSNWVKKNSTNENWNKTIENGYDYAMNNGSWEAIVQFFRYLPGAIKSNRIIGVDFPTYAIWDEVLKVKWGTIIEQFAPVENTFFMNGGNVLPESIPESLTKKLESILEIK